MVRRAVDLRGELLDLKRAVREMRGGLVVDRGPEVAATGVLSARPLQNHPRKGGGLSGSL